MSGEDDSHLTHWQPPPEAVRAVAEGYHGDPFSLLGPHGGGDEPFSVRAFAPEADRVAVVESIRGRVVSELGRVGERGFFAGPVRRRRRFPYRLRLWKGEHEWERDDPYRFGPVLGDLDLHLLAEGNHLHLYDALGAHPRTHEGVEGVAFAVWAPNARRVSVIGPFNDWDGRRNPMRLRHGSGVWEIFMPGLEPGTLYKFEILGANGAILAQKADPVGFAMEPPPQTASVVVAPLPEAVAEGAWMQARAAAHDRTAPIAAYECHLGSWQHGDDGRLLSYDALADRLIPYVLELGFTHIELLPVSEHPFTGSWGYQPTGLFAPTARFGPPEAFARFVARCHDANLGVILDWVPGHFPDDPHGLAQFDGTALYEHQDPRLGLHRDWNTLIYNYGRREVANFLYANALFWLRRYGVDGLRVDAVASMLYLDYSRQPGEWVPNQHGGNENLDAIAFLRRLNTLVFGECPGTTTVAEESTAWPGVSRPVDGGGLGFGFKWNMGWMHDTLDYMSRDPVHRKHHQHQMTFGIDYAFSENFILPLSHDEVVYGKGSLLGKMPGDKWQKVANLRAYYGFMWAHPGKKLLFMGGEFGQEREWHHDRALDWHLLDDPMHAGVRRLVGDLNRLYRQTPALHVNDCSPDGFEWIDASDTASNILCFLRKGGEGDPPVLVVSNFAPVVREGYRVGVPIAGRWIERLNTDAREYGGSGHGNLGGVEAESESWHGRPTSLRLTLPPLATLIMVAERR